MNDFLPFWSSGPPPRGFVSSVTAEKVTIYHCGLCHVALDKDRLEYRGQVACRHCGALNTLG